MAPFGGHAFDPYDRAAEQMAKIIDFKGLAAPEPQRKSG